MSGSTRLASAALVEDLPPDRLFLDGEWVAASSGAVLDVVDPADEQVVGTVAAAGVDDVDRAVAAARAAFDEGPWPRMSVAERSEVLDRVAALYPDVREPLARLVTQEMGCPITLSRTMQATTPQVVLQSALETAREFPYVEPHRSATGSALLLREPVGVVAAVVPWNSPHTSALAKLGPALLSGCTAILKPAPETALDALVLARMFNEAGLPPGVLGVLPADRETAFHLVGHPGVDKVAFTGSTAAGRAIAARCGHDLRRVTLELGGKSAAVVLPEADVDTVVGALRLLGLRNTGQVCTNNTRVLVPRALAGRVVDALADLMASMVVGPPLDETTEVGPVVTARQRERVEEYIRSGTAEGARLVYGGGRPAGLDRGWFVQPTLFADVDNRMRIAREEIFGPVLSVITYDTEEEAVRIANDSDYGLSGSVFGDPEHALTVARAIRSGAVQVNGAPAGFQAPFGGIKASGLGRENGPEGFAAYVETKAVGVAPELLAAITDGPVA